MEFKADALLLRAVDYGENDRIATLLTAERGKIGAALKGVRKAGAKLRFAAHPIGFAEGVLALPEVPPPQAVRERAIAPVGSPASSFFSILKNLFPA